MDKIKIDQALERIESQITLLSSNEKTFYTLSEAAAFLGLKKSYLYKLTSQKKVCHYKPGKNIYFKKKDLEEYLLKNEIDVFDNDSHSSLDNWKKK